MKRRRIIKKHFVPGSVLSPINKADVAEHAARKGTAVHISEALPYWITHGINKVYGATPATVFEPQGPIASIRRTISVPAKSSESEYDIRHYAEPKASIVREKKVNKGWLKIQSMLNGEADIIRGYDDGECEPQQRGIH